MLLRLPFIRRDRVNRNRWRARDYEWEQAARALRGALVFLFIVLILGLAFSRAWDH